MNYDRRPAERRKPSATNESSREYHQLIRWVWALIAVAFVLSLIR